MADREIDYTDYKPELETNQRLADNLALFDHLKDDLTTKKREFEKAQRAYEAARKTILAEVYAANPAAEGVLIHAPRVLDRPLRMTWVPQRKFDRDGLAAAYPQIEEQFTVERDANGNPLGYWRLARS